MAKLSRLIPFLAKILGMRETAVLAYARTLRKAKEISSGGRGPGGAEMTARDCTNLLLAVMAGTPTYAVERVRVIQSMITVPEGTDEYGANLLATLGLPAQHSFPEMVERLIHLAEETHISSLFERSQIDCGLIPDDQRHDYYSNILIDIELPDLRAHLSAEIKNFGSGTPIGTQLVTYFPGRYWGLDVDPLPEEPAITDLRHKVAVSQITIGALGKLLVEN